MSEKIRPSVVDLKKGYWRKYWTNKQESITVRCRSTTAEASGADSNAFRNWFRYFLYCLPPCWQDELDAMNDEDRALMAKKHVRYLADVDDAIDTLELDASVSTSIRGYEKEVFYLKCLSLELKPPVALRVILRISRKRPGIEEVFTSPELLFNLVHVLEGNPVFRKDIRWTIS